MALKLACSACHHPSFLGFPVNWVWVLAGLIGENNLGWRRKSGDLGLRGGGACLRGGGGCKWCTPFTAAFPAHTVKREAATRSCKAIFISRDPLIHILLIVFIKGAVTDIKIGRHVNTRRTKEVP
jgi:hypothetical protein